MECTLCGKDVPFLNKTEIEGSIIDVCDKCVGFGVKIFDRKIAYAQIKEKIEFEKISETNSLIENYGRVVKIYRENKGLTRVELAKVLNEKESVLKRIEEEQLRPDNDLIKRLERFFGVKLSEEYEETTLPKNQKKNVKLTVGSMVEV